MESEYGPKKGEEVFYASRNKGTIAGVDEQMPEPETIPSRLTAAEVNEMNRKFWEQWAPSGQPSADGDGKAGTEEEAHTGHK